VDQVTQIDTPAVRRCADLVADVAARFDRARQRFGDSHLDGDPVWHAGTSETLRYAETWWDDQLAALSAEIRDFGRALSVAATDFRTSDQDSARRIGGNRR
jgi:hypothetical protein